jgi:hypothetical protein
VLWSDEHAHNFLPVANVTARMINTASKHPNYTKINHIPREYIWFHDFQIINFNCVIQTEIQFKKFKHTNKEATSEVRGKIRQLFRLQIHFYNPSNLRYDAGSKVEINYYNVLEYR